MPPVKIWSTLAESERRRPVGVLRALNANSKTGHHPLTYLELARLRVCSHGLAVYTERYVRALSILHDQERATHGYNTDLLAIKYAARNIERWLEQLRPLGASDAKGLNALDEIFFRTRDIISVQDNMASQLLTVMHYSQNTYLSTSSADKATCDQPFTSVFMRILAAKKGMSDCYGRQEIKVTFNGKPRHDEEFMRMPPLKVTVGLLYLAVRNVVENAIKYSRKAMRPELDISWRVRGRLMEIRLRDHGIGIPPQDRDQIGREGFRGRKAQELQLRGNGLGLAVSSAMLKAAGGDIRYEPPADDLPGSVFIIAAPLQ